MWWNEATNRRVVHLSFGGGSKLSCNTWQVFIYAPQSKPTSQPSRTDRQTDSLLGGSQVAGRWTCHQTTKPKLGSGQPEAGRVGRAVNSVLCWLALITRFVFQKLWRVVLNYVEKRNSSTENHRSHCATLYVCT